MDNAPVVRDNGRFPKGVSGNPAGRPKGSRNHLVQLQQDLEIAVREHVSVERIKRIVNKVCDLAENGSISAAKLILDKVIANATPPADDAQDNGRTVVFRIENATFAAQQPAEPPPIDITPTSQESNGKE